MRSQYKSTATTRDHVIRPVNTENIWGGLSEKNTGISLSAKSLHSFNNMPVHTGSGRIQTKLTVNRPGDEQEQEADAVADKVMRMPETPSIQRKCAKCEEEEEKKQLQRKAVSPGITPAAGSTGMVNASLNSRISSSRGSGHSMDSGTHSFMSGRFGADFSKVRIHTDNEAAKMNRELSARAFTIGSDIYFNQGEYQPSSREGKSLLAHELVHVQQQGPGLIRRCVNPKKNDPIYDGVAKSIKGLSAYTALSVSDKGIADGIITDAKTRGACLYYIGELQKLFQTPVKAAATISTETKASTATAVAKEQTRVAKPAEAKNLDIEKKAADDPSRVWTPIKGKFGDGTYFVDKSNPKNIVVKAKIFLKAQGTGTQADIDSIKSMQDAIEKAASTRGYLVSLEFVNNDSDPNTFKVDVDPSKWETATNWSGGEPKGFAHELHHMFAFELDRYNYIVAHAGNKSMEVADRLYWFAEEMKKPAGFNDPTSIMDDAAHPNDDDVCRVAGLDLPTCLAARRKP